MSRPSQPASHPVGPGREAEEPASHPVGPGREAEEPASHPVGPGREAEEPTGFMALVLHSHMPYVEGFGTYPFGEEWLFDAVLRSYLPLFEVAERLTLTITPVLADQLEAPQVGERLLAFGREFRLDSVLADAEQVDSALRPACLEEADRYRRGLRRLTELGSPLDLFSAAAREGRVELIGSAATHAVLPLIATDAARRLQVDAGLRSHRRRFGPTTGLWLPECAYEPGLERLLAEHGLNFFCVDQSTHEPPERALRPVATDTGVVAFPIDWEAVSWLWSHDGYPSDPVHTDFHRKTLRGARPWAIGGDARDPDAGANRAREQAHNLLEGVAERLRRHRARTGSAGLVVFAIDTELLGHWWWEGPDWLEAVIQGAQAQGVELVTLSQALSRVEPEHRALHRSSWGERKDLSTWDSREIVDLVWGARRLELRLLRELTGRRLAPAAAERAARELLALQASDWAFLDNRRQAGDYPFQRVVDHARSLLDCIHSADPPNPRLRNLAPDLSLAPLFQA